MDFLFIIVILIMSVVVHEVAHGFAALWLGDPTAKYEGRLTLNPISHFDPIGSFFFPLFLRMVNSPFIIAWAKPVPYEPSNLRNVRWGEALVAAAGPLANILLATIFALILRGSLAYGLATASFLYIVLHIISVNVSLAIFNLTPIPPLDGSKILFSVFPNSLYRLRQRLERSGPFILMVFIIFFSQFLAPIGNLIFGLLVGNVPI